MSEPPIRILIVDDHPAIRIGLAAMLGGHPQLKVVGEAGDVESALQSCGDLQPDVTLMDLRIPGGGGVEATLAIRQRWPSVRVLVVTTYDGDEDIHRAVQAGASGYVLKGLTSAELIAAVLTVAKGGRALPPPVASALAERMNRKNLTGRELEIVQRIVNGRSNKEIAADLAIGEESVKSHLRTLFLKLGVADRTQAAIEAIRHGIVHLD
jgi:two-component system NarL family response regulator